MHQVKPAMILRDGKRGPRRALSVLLVLMALWAVGSLVAAAVEIVGGATGVFDYGDGTVPLWAAWAASAALGAYVTWDTYGNWRMTGSDHGILDHALEPSGIRLMRPRAGRRGPELLVQRGEVVTIDAQLVRRRRGGTDRIYSFKVAAPAGSFTFTQPIYIEKLSLVPLDETARDLGVVVETTGEATAVERLGVAA